MSCLTTGFWCCDLHWSTVYKAVFQHGLSEWVLDKGTLPGNGGTRKIWSIHNMLLWSWFCASVTCRVSSSSLWYMLAYPCKINSIAELLWSILCVKKSWTVRLALPWPSIHKLWVELLRASREMFCCRKICRLEVNTIDKNHSIYLLHHLFNSSHDFNNLEHLRGSHENETSKLKVEHGLASRFSEWLCDCSNETYVSDLCLPTSSWSRDYERWRCGDLQVMVLFRFGVGGGGVFFFF